MSINLIKNSDDLFTTIEDMSIDDLEKAIIIASDKYYNDDPIISDAAFDMLRDFLQMKKPNSPILKKIGAPVKTKDKVDLPYYLGSMDKIKPPSNKLNNWKEDYFPPYILSDKLDGVSALLLYKNNEIRLFTRGTATEGMDITMLLRYIKNIPSYEHVMDYLKKNNMGKTIAFRGELVISKVRFEKKWAKTMKNSRNAVSGLVNSKNINPKLARSTNLVLYQIISPAFTQIDQLRIIKELGFKTVHNKVIEDINFEYLSKYLLKRRDTSKYIIDGIIITNNDVHPINKDGNPKYAWAFKDVLEDQKAISKVVNIEWNQTKDGLLMPTIIIEPVDVGGVTIKRVTGNNAKFIVDNKLGIGAEVEVIRSNDVIPKIENVIKGAKVELPDGEWQESGVHLLSLDKDSEDIAIKNIYYFFSTIGTMGLGEKIVEKIYNAGYKTILDFLKLTVDDILKIDGFKQKSSENIVASIVKSTTNISLPILMKASNKLGRGMGEERSKDVLLKYPNIMEEYTNYTDDEFKQMLKKLDGWEDKTSAMFVKNFKYFIEFYNSIKKYIKVDIVVNKPKKGSLTGMNIVISGFRDKKIEDLIEENGGELSSGVSKTTSILIIKDKSVIDTGKVVKAKELGVKIYTVDEFKDLL
jgi:DNA ligase (NAD+)